VGRRLHYPSPSGHLRVTTVREYDYFRCGGYVNQFCPVTPTPVDSKPPVEIPSTHLGLGPSGILPRIRPAVKSSPVSYPQAINSTVEAARSNTKTLETNIPVGYHDSKSTLAQVIGLPSGSNEGEGRVVIQEDKT